MLEGSANIGLFFMGTGYTVCICNNYVKLHV
uniref:Uncharacterized protein n=1 Tax=Arundo donax TaxID=35708 RepID=A0A0A9H091_ARUDO